MDIDQHYVDWLIMFRVMLMLSQEQSIFFQVICLKSKFIYINYTSTAQFKQTYNLARV